MDLERIHFRAKHEEGVNKNWDIPFVSSIAKPTRRESTKPLFRRDKKKFRCTKVRVRKEKDEKRTFRLSCYMPALPVIVAFK